MFDGYGEREAIVWNDQSYSYEWLRSKTGEWQDALREHGIKSGQIVALEGDYSASICALLLALIHQYNIIVPLSTSVPAADKIEFLATGNVEILLKIHNQEDRLAVEGQSHKPQHPLLQELIDTNKPGLILFSSGSTGKSKGAVHDFTKLMHKYQKPGKAWRSLVFLLFDHIGGINTILSILSSGGTMIIQNSRNPADVCYSIAKHRVELLPTTPTFLNLLLLSREYKEYDLSSLQLITYGTEPMPEFTLKKAAGIFPGVKFKQTYGLSETGIVGTKSESDTSLWVKLGGTGYDFKILDDILWIKSESSMLGYLNAPSPFDQDGWFNTQDMVLQKGEYLKILGRETEIINVGGQKVYPAEVENTLMEMENVKDVLVRGEKNPIMGNIVCARVCLADAEALKSLKKRIYQFCRPRLESYKIPVKVEIVEGSLAGSRFKKIRC